MMRESSDVGGFHNPDDAALDALLRAANASTSAPAHLHGRIAQQIGRNRRRRRIIAGSCAAFTIVIASGVLMMISQPSGLNDPGLAAPPRIAEGGGALPSNEHVAHDTRPAADDAVIVRFPEESQVYAHRLPTEDPNITIIMIYERLDSVAVKSVRPEGETINNTTEEGTSS